MVRQSNLVFHIHKQRSLFPRCCHTNWHFMLWYQLALYAVIPIGTLCCHINWHFMLSYQLALYAVIPIGTLCCHTNWHFSFVIIKWKVTSSAPKIAAISSKGYWILDTGSCKLCRNLRWMFGILGFVKFDRCCMYVSLYFQCSRISWRKVEINWWTLQVVAFVI